MEDNTIKEYWKASNYKEKILICLILPFGYSLGIIKWTVWGITWPIWWLHERIY